VTETVEIFFPPEVEIYDSGYEADIPNWFYYWKEGGVIGASNFYYNLESQYESWCGYYLPSTGELFLCDGAPGSADMEETLTNQYYGTSINSGPDGIADVSVNSEEQEDDVQVIPVGQGEPNQTAITAGPNSTLDTSPGGDDTVQGSTITTGPNGVCNTNVSGDDVQVIPVGQGKPYSIIITAGTDGFMHSADDSDGVSRLTGTDDLLDLTGAETVEFEIDCSGIDLAATTCSHELFHKYLYDMVGGPPSPDSTSDGDYVDNNYEISSGYHLDPKRYDTYNCAGVFEAGNDNEFLAYMAQSSASANPDIDWSVGGKQWQQ
ncbi:MAG: hypothetical protein PVJ60_07150, partial [Phycisphaerales bacterium]|jgi:hypothetical protein